MSHPLRALSRAALAGLADALTAGRLRPPYSSAALAAHAPNQHVDAIAAALNELHQGGMSPGNVSTLLRLLAEERAAAQRISDRIELVWSPPGLDCVDARDTAVVVKDLFREAQRSVLIVTYSLDRGDKAKALFGELAARMDAEPALAVRLLANIQRPYDDDVTDSATLVSAFAERFRANTWPGERLPEMFYDPRAVALEFNERAALHAKCIVIDSRRTFFTSANFSEAAQTRNIEAGAVIDDPHLAQRVTQQFSLLIEREQLLRVPL